MNGRQQLQMAMAAPVLITILGAVLKIKPMFIGGLVFCGLIVLAAILNYRSSRW